MKITSKQKKELEKKCDDLWTRIVKIRANFTCEITEEKWELKYLVSHHIAGKQKSWMRWNLDNGVCLYSGSHFLIHSQDTTIAHYSIEKLKQKRGNDWYASLLEGKRFGTQVKLNELKSIYKYLFEIYDDMPEDKKSIWKIPIKKINWIN